MNRNMQRGKVPHPWVLSAVRQVRGRAIRSRYEIVTEGMDDIPKEDAVVALANHRNNPLDVEVIGTESPRDFYFPAKSELNEGLKGRVLRASGALYFIRGDEEDEKRVAEESGRLLGYGAAVLFFWEGTSKNRGQQLGPVKAGPVAAALRYNTPLYLIGVAGTEEPTDGRVHVVAKGPYDVGEFRRKEPTGRTSPGNC